MADDIERTYDRITDDEKNEAKEAVQEHIKKHGISGLEKLLKAKLEAWKDVEINIGVTGDSGVGKSSFINTIRGLGDDEEGSATTGFTETTRESAVYTHPTNAKIKFWDLPGIGTPNYPDLSTYCKKVGLEKYDTFLIFTAGRFTQNDLALAEKVKSCKKSFFLVRNKIDSDRTGELRKKNTPFNEKDMLKKIRENCWKNLQSCRDGDEEVFLISNYHPDEFDFDRLTQAILDVLPSRQRECLTLSLNVLTSHSKEMLKRKVEILQDRIKWVASASAAGGAIPVPGLSALIDAALITTEVNFYKTQLGLPDETSVLFQKLTPENREKIRKLLVTGAVHVANLIAAYAVSSTVEEFVRFIPIFGPVIAGGISFSSTYGFLKSALDDFEETALEYLDVVSTRAAADMPLD